MTDYPKRGNLPLVPTLTIPSPSVAAAQIAEMDKTVLSSLRRLWMETDRVEEKAKWLKRLDENLDERLRLMRFRDTPTL